MSRFDRDLRILEEEAKTLTPDQDKDKWILLTLKIALLKASDVIQRTAEAAGTIRILDASLEDMDTDSYKERGVFVSDELWALRNAMRNVEDATEDAGRITDLLEDVQRVVKGGAKHV